MTKKVRDLMVCMLLAFNHFVNGQVQTILNILPFNIELGKTTLESIKESGHPSTYNSDSLHPVFFSIPHYCSVTLNKKHVITELRVYAFCDSLVEPEAWTDLGLRFANDRKEGTSKTVFDSVLKILGVKEIYEQTLQGYSNYYWKSGNYFFKAEICTGSMSYGFMCSDHVERKFKQGLYEIEISIKSMTDKRMTLKKRTL